MTPLSLLLLFPFLPSTTSLTEVKKYPACVSTYGIGATGENGCQQNEALKKMGPIRKDENNVEYAEYFCARDCLSYEMGPDMPSCQLEAINDPSVCKECDGQSSDRPGVCQPCCRCWDTSNGYGKTSMNPFAQEDQDRDPVMKCVDVCKGHNDKKDGDWNGCERFFAKAGRVTQGVGGVAVAAIVTYVML